ncbi:hypothetical protein Btru_044283 [Bulinus truncatus]|nr:hypothetical protein Btru_044283 [Bulinus truncatus]
MDAPASMSTSIAFYKIGLGDKNEINSKGWRMKTLKQHLKDTHFWGVTIDYLKMDIEYSEWSVLRQAVRDGALKNVKQLAFEMHTPELFRIYKKKGESFPERSREKDRSDFIIMFDTLFSLEAQGFRKFNYRLNPFGEYEMGCVPHDAITPTGRCAPRDPITPTGRCAPHDPITPTARCAPRDPITPTGRCAPRDPITPTGRCAPHDPITS